MTSPWNWLRYLIIIMVVTTMMTMLMMTFGYGYICVKEGASMLFSTPLNC